MSALSFRLVSKEEMASLGRPNQNEMVGVALNDALEVVSMVSFNTAFRGTMCNSCTRNCATGGMVWTRTDYRAAGVFRELFDWTQSQLGIDKVYIHNKSLTGTLIAQRFGFAVPQIDMPLVGNLYLEELTMESLAVQIQEVI